MITNLWKPACLYSLKATDTSASARFVLASMGWCRRDHHRTSHSPQTSHSPVLRQLPRLRPGVHPAGRVPPAAGPLLPGLHGGEGRMTAETRLAAIVPRFHGFTGIDVDAAKLRAIT